MRSSLSYSFADFRRKERAGSSNFENLKLIGGDAFIAKRLQKNPVRKRTYVRRRGFPLMLPQHGCHYNVVAIRKAQKGCHAAAPSFCFLLVSYVLLRFHLELLFVLRRVSLPPFAFSPPASSELRPSGLTWRLRSVTTFLRKLQKVLFASALTRCISGPCGLRWKRVPAPKVVPPLAPPHGHGSNCLAAHPKKRAMSVECM